MKHLSKFAAAGLLAATLTAASQAQATPMIQYSTTGSAASFVALPTVAGVGNSQIYTGGTLNGLSVSVTTVSSNAPGAPTLAETLSTSLSISNSTSSTATLYLSFGDIGFTAPSAPPSLVLDSHIGGTVPITSAADVIAFTSYVDSSNAQNSITGLATPTGFPAIPGTNNGSFSNDQLLTVTTLGTPYSMTELLKVTLGAGSQINFSASTTLTPVPEPMTLGLLGVGLAGLGLVRRRRAG